MLLLAFLNAALKAITVTGREYAAQQAGDRPAPDFLHGVLLKEDIAPDAVFNIKPATGEGQMNVRMLVELTAVGVQGTEDTDLQTCCCALCPTGARIPAPGKNFPRNDNPALEYRHRCAGKYVARIRKNSERSEAHDRSGFRGESVPGGDRRKNHVCSRSGCWSCEGQDTTKRALSEEHLSGNHCTRASASYFYD